MAEAAQDLRGHNQPPESTPDQAEIIRARLEEENGPLLKRRDELLEAFERAPATVEDDDAARKVTDFVKQLTACAKDADSRRVAAKEPYLSGGRAVDGFFTPIKDAVGKAKASLESRLTDYQRKKAAEERRRREEEERKAREEAEARAREAEERAKAAETEGDLEAAIDAEDAAKQADADAVKASKEAGVKAADLHKDRGDLGAVASLRTFWDFEITDARVIDLEALRPHIPLGAIEQGVRSFVKAGGRELRGARIFENTKSVVR